jgi:tetratricopeptide (TPR) repeat protein
MALETEQQALRLVTDLYQELIGTDAVVERLRSDPSLDEGVRQRALVLSKRRRVDPDSLNSLAWSLVRGPDASPEENQRALAMMREATRVAPDHAPYLNTLGVAEYRTGLYPQASATLTRSMELARANIGYEYPHDLAFLAMCSHRMGRAQDAARYAEEARTIAARRWRGDTELAGILREMESVLAEGPDG